MTASATTTTATGRGRGLLDIPGPAGGWLLGNAMPFRRDLLATLTHGMHEYGDVVRHPAGPRGARLQVQQVLHNPRDVHQVLTQTEKTFSKDTRVFQAMAEMLGRGLLTTTGDEWRRQRRVVQPLFTQRRVEGCLGLMAEEAAVLTTSAPSDGSTVDLHLLMMSYALRVVGRALFGDDIEVEDLVPGLDELVPEASSITGAGCSGRSRLPSPGSCRPTAGRAMSSGASTRSSTRSRPARPRPGTRATAPIATTS